MTLRACMGKLIRHMVRIRGALEIRLMTRVTILRRARELPVRVTLCARYYRMCSAQLEPCQIVIKRCRSPATGGMTFCTGMVVIPCGVIRVCGLVIIGRMAGKALRRCARVLLISMTLIARHCRVRTGESEGCQVMIERCRRPAVGGMTLRAGMAVISGTVIGICRSVIIRLVARVAIGGQAAAVLAIRMALHANYRGMRACQRK